MNERYAPRHEGDINRTAGRRAWQQRWVGEASLGLLHRDETAFIHQSLSTPCLTAVQHADGIWLQDLEGKRYLDFHGNSVHHLGYGHPRVVDAIKTQLDTLSFCPRRFTNESTVSLAERLVELSPIERGRVLFTTGGSDAIEVALKLARLATGRFKTLSFWDAFHGAGFGASTVGGESTFRGYGLGPLLPGAEHVAPFACYRCPYGHDVDEDGKPDLNRCGMACAEMIGYVLEKEGDIAALVAEPVRAVPYVPPPGFWERVRECCDRHGTLLIFDEIPNGLGKTGRWFAAQHFDVEPDICVVGKSLGGGVLPIAAVIAKDALNVAGRIAIGHYTHEKNPVTAAAALATLDTIEQEGLVGNAEAMGSYALSRMRALKARHELIGDVRGLGLSLGIELIVDPATREPNHVLAEKVLYKSLSNGLSFKTAMGNVLTLSPPLIVTKEHIDTALDVIDEALGDAQ